jgi:ATP synthase protein I
MGEPIDHGLAPTSEEDVAQEEVFKVLTREEALVLRALHPVVSPRQIIVAQAALGLFCALVAWWLTRSGNVAAAALYGAAVVVLPGGLLARGMGRGARNPVALAAGFMFWELIKIAVAVTMLVAAAVLVPGLSWAALLLTMIVCMKMGWLVLLLKRRRPVVTETQHKRA